MSYDLAVWEGERPADDKTARQFFRELYDRYIDGEVMTCSLPNIFGWNNCVARESICRMTLSLFKPEVPSSGPQLTRAGP
ncbi:hypothetical protein SUDANB5_06859 [Streptomyces sp. SudanB5_2050]|uniref:hypothetical protein n=1 Tax=Streptomyces sp. SudanB5_2050 TaxID=3035274 RepID=UPI0036DEA8E2